MSEIFLNYYKNGIFVSELECQQIRFSDVGMKHLYRSDDAGCPWARSDLNTLTIYSLLIRRAPDVSCTQRRIHKGLKSRQIRVYAYLGHIRIPQLYYIQCCIDM